jgi:hypothetical protein
MRVSEILLRVIINLVLNSSSFVESSYNHNNLLCIEHAPLLLLELLVMLKQGKLTKSTAKN